MLVVAAVQGQEIPLVARVVVAEAAEYQIQPNFPELQIQAVGAVAVVVALLWVLAAPALLLFDMKAHNEALAEQ